MSNPLEDPVIVATFSHIEPAPPQHLDAISAVRKRPHMYLGDVGSSGLSILFKEIVMNAINEVREGYCTRIDVVYGADHRLSVSDSGRGIPVENYKNTGKSVVELEFTEMTCMFMLRSQRYKIAPSLYGVGATMVNALSRWLECEVRQGGKIYRQRFERGRLTAPITAVGECGADEHGTKVTWLADDIIFPQALDGNGRPAYSVNTLRSKICELAFLHKNLTLSFVDEQRGTEPEIYQYPQGIAAYVEHLNANRKPVHHPVIYLDYSAGDTQIEAALQFTEDTAQEIRSYANDVHTTDGGTHVAGFKTALLRSLSHFGREQGLLTKKLPREAIQHGLTAVINVRLPNAYFGSATKTKLTNPEFPTVMSQAVSKGLAWFFEQNPDAVRVIIERVLKPSLETRRIG